VLGNWQLAPLLRTTSGVPLNIQTGKDNSLTGVGLDRPNQVLSNAYTSAWGPSLQYINPAAFAPNALGTFGNVGRNSVRGVGALNLDAALSRLFSIREQWRLEVRAEAFNVLNHTNFTGVSTSLSSSTFGRITVAGDPRILQFALKLLF
jgi:hypothetical protein